MYKINNNKSYKYCNYHIFIIDVLNMYKVHVAPILIGYLISFPQIY